MTNAACRHELYILMARAESEQSSCRFWRSGAVIVMEDRVLIAGHSELAVSSALLEKAAGGCERPRCQGSPTEMSEGNVCTHCLYVDATANALARAARSGVCVEGASLYSTLAPCIMSLCLIATARIRAVYFEQDYELDTPERTAFWLDFRQKASLDFCGVLKVGDGTSRFRTSEIWSTDESSRLP